MKTGSISAIACVLVPLSLASPAASQDFSKVPASDWIRIFNGKDLEGWVKKIRTHPVGEDPYNTWYVKDSLLWVDYSKYTAPFNYRFGHMAYEKRKFSYFLLRAVYQFWGSQPPTAPSEGKQNNGLMFHSESMSAMARDAQFPASAEVQLLGENNNQNTEGTTANFCCVGATMVVNGNRIDGCWKAAPRNIKGLPWVKVEVLILADSVGKHMVEGDTVMRYTKILAKRDGKPLREGYIAIQAESAPTYFKTLEVLDLEGCTDPKAVNFRSYFIKSNPSECQYVSSIRPAPRAQDFQVRMGHLLGIHLPRAGFHALGIRDLSGRLLWSMDRKGQAPGSLPTLPSGN